MKWHKSLIFHTFQNDYVTLIICSHYLLPLLSPILFVKHILWLAIWRYCHEYNVLKALATFIYEWRCAWGTHREATHRHSRSKSDGNSATKITITVSATLCGYNKILNCYPVPLTPINMYLYMLKSPSLAIRPSVLTFHGNHKFYYMIFPRFPFYFNSIFCTVHSLHCASLSRHFILRFHTLPCQSLLSLFFHAHTHWSDSHS